MASYEETRGHLLRILRDQDIFEQDPETIIDTDLVESGIIDSLTMTQLRALVQEEFDVDIDEKTLIEKLHTINDVIHYLMEQAA